MYVAYELRRCELCRQPYGFGYQWPGVAFPEAGQHLVIGTLVRCPHPPCRHENPHLGYVEAARLEVLALPPVLVAGPGFRPNTLRRLQAWR